MIDRDTVITALREVYDPCCRERGISVVDMGLIEDVVVDDGTVRVDMVLTSGWCPSVALLDQSITESVESLDGVQSAEVRVVFDPVWSMDRLSEDARSKLEMNLEPLIPYRNARIARTPVEVTR